MGHCRLPKHQRFYHLLAVAFVVSLLSACATTSQTVTPQVAAPPPPPAKVTGRVVDIKKNLPVRVDTNLTSKQLGDLGLGDKVEIDEESGEWYHVIQIVDEQREQVQSKRTKGKPIRSGPVSCWVLSKYIEKDYVPPPPPVAAPSPAEQNQEGSKNLTGMKIRTTLEGLGAGAVVGAGLGALTAYLTGGSVAQGAIVGAAAGGAVGLVAGVSVANQKEKFATEEAYLDACMKEAAQANEEARKINDYMRGYIGETQLRIKELTAQIKKDKTKKQLARDDLSTLNDKKQGLDKVITGLEDQAKAQDGAVAGVKKSSPQSAALQQEVQTTRQEIERLKKQREELATLTMKMNELTV
jgi:archaellum component FlaC